MSYLKLIRIVRIEKKLRTNEILFSTTRPLHSLLRLVILNNLPGLPRSVFNFFLPPLHFCATNWALHFNFLFIPVFSVCFVQVYPEGFFGKQLTTADREELATIAACFWVQNELNARKFTNDLPSSQTMLKSVPKTWSLSVSLAEQNTTCQITTTDDGYYSVKFLWLLL